LSVTSNFGKNPCFLRSLRINRNAAIAGSKIGWVLEADLKNFFGSLSHEWLLRFVEHRVGDPRLISLIRRWLKAGVLEDREVHPNEEGARKADRSASC
jgi:retron-type reverse transcriptase